jgi:hypothetical protein
MAPQQKCMLGQCFCSMVKTTAADWRFSDAGRFSAWRVTSMPASEKPTQKQSNGSAAKYSLYRTGLCVGRMRGANFRHPFVTPALKQASSPNITSAETIAQSDRRRSPPQQNRMDRHLASAGAGRHPSSHRRRPCKSSSSESWWRWPRSPPRLRVSHASCK